MVLNGDFILFHLTLHFLLFKQTVQTSDLVCTVCNIPALSSVQVLQITLYTTLWRHSDKNSKAINNRFLDLLVSAYHVDNNLKKI